MEQHCKRHNKTFPGGICPGCEKEFAPKERISDQDLADHIKNEDNSPQSWTDKVALDLRDARLALIARIRSLESPTCKESLPVAPEVPTLAAQSNVGTPALESQPPPAKGGTPAEAGRWTRSRTDIQSYDVVGDPVVYLYPPDESQERIGIRGSDCQATAARLLAALNSSLSADAPKAPAEVVALVENYRSALFRHLESQQKFGKEETKERLEKLEQCESALLTALAPSEPLRPIPVQNNPDVFYLLSMKHTNKVDKCLTFWGPDDAGYRLCLEGAGKYTRAQIERHPSYYNNQQCTAPVPVDLVDSLAVKNELQYGKTVPFKHMKKLLAARFPLPEPIQGKGGAQ